MQSCNAYACSDWVASNGTSQQPAPKGTPSLSAPSTDGDGSYTISWSRASGSTATTLQESKNNGGWSTIYSGSGTSKAVSGKSNATYGYRAQGCNSEGCGPWSSTKSVKVTSVPVKPTGLTLTLGGNSKSEYYRGGWNAVAGATRYEVIRDDGLNLYSGPDTSTFISTSFLPETAQRHGYKVRACNAVGCSAWAVKS